MLRLSVVLALAAVASGAGDTFLLETRKPAPYTPAYLGNGEMGLSTSPPGTTATECFMSGVYDHAPGDVVRLAVVPAWNEIDVFNGASWLNRTPPDITHLRAYQQVLNMYDGALRTGYEWTDARRVTGIRVETFVSRADPNAGSVRIAISPQFDGPMTVRLPLRAWPPPHRYPLEKLEKLDGPSARSQQAIWYPGRMIAREQHAEAGTGSGLLQMFSQAEGGSTAVSQTVALTWPPEGKARPRETAGEAVVDVEFNARSGQTYTFTKYAAAIASPDGQRLLPAAIAKARAGAARGYDKLFAAHASAWHTLWESDVVVEGDPTLQTVIHSMLFYLLGSARAGSRFSVPPMGLSTAGYYGHVFWDADTYMFPPLLLLHPEIAKTMVMFRARTLDAARANARRNGYQGAMYPWEAGPDGAETTPRFAFQNALYENHVNGDVALAAWQYYLATGDRAWLEQYGYPILHDTAAFWVSRAARTLGKAPDAKWSEVSGKMYLPRADLLLIDYPLEFPVNADEQRAIVNSALAKPPEGAMMEVEFYPVLGAELQDKNLINALLPRTWRPYVRPPFNALPETPTNDNINFITGAGAFLQQFLYGYSGLRLSEQGLSQRYKPLLPGSVQCLVLRGVMVRGKRREIAIRDGTIE